jgi:cysteinyl-tRNA synthetase
LHALASKIRTSASGFAQTELKRRFKASAKLMGLLARTKKEYLASDPQRVLIDQDKVETFIAARGAARARKDFKESDRIRDELAKMGVVVKDGKDAKGNPVTTWEIAR